MTKTWSERRAEKRAFKEEQRELEEQERKAAEAKLAHLRHKHSGYVPPGNIEACKQCGAALVWVCERYDRVQRHLQVIVDHDGDTRLRVVLGCFQRHLAKSEAAKALEPAP